MKIIKLIFSMVLLTAVMGSCQKAYDDISFVENSSAPAKLSALFEITQDNSGIVTITPNGEGATSYDIFYGDATTIPAKVKPGGNTQHKYAEGVFNVKIVAYNASGKTTEATQPLTVSFKKPENLVVTAEIDPANNFKVKVSAKADFETMFRVTFGQDPNQVPVTFLEGETKEF